MVGILASFMFTGRLSSETVAINRFACRKLDDGHTGRESGKTQTKSRKMQWRTAGGHIEG